MKIKRFFIIIAAATLLALLMVACQMPASTPPPTPDAGATGTDTGFPRPEDVTNESDSMGVPATQTAVAESGGTETGGTETGGTETGGTETGGTETGGTETGGTETGGTETGGGEPSGSESGGGQTESQQQEVSVPSPTPGVPQSYTINPGEFPYCIARRYNVNPTELLSLNGLTSYSTVLAGTTLRMPQTGNPFPDGRALASHPTTYTVQSGDTIYKIACKFGDVDPIYMAQVNGLKSPYSLTVGQTLQIP